MCYGIATHTLHSPCYYKYKLVSVSLPQFSSSNTIAAHQKHYLKHHFFGSPCQTLTHTLTAGSLCINRATCLAISPPLSNSWLCLSSAGSLSSGHNSAALCRPARLRRSEPFTPRWTCCLKPLTMREQARTTQRQWVESNLVLIMGRALTQFKYELRISMS